MTKLISRNLYGWSVHFNHFIVKQGDYHLLKSFKYQAYVFLITKFQSIWNKLLAI